MPPLAILLLRVDCWPSPDTKVTSSLRDSYVDDLSNLNMDLPVLFLDLIHPTIYKHKIPKPSQVHGLSNKY
ncbi:MAG: hypothetical protein J3R72DRAFT_494890 [Linnemannia gamsii]|nr:MAG: hypothetical protein J3R72DRAFT_494890 [Linnemannia gamsii]